MNDADSRRKRGDDVSSRAAERGFRLLRRHGVPVDVLCVVSAANVAEPVATYRYFRELGVTRLQFLHHQIL